MKKLFLLVFLSASVCSYAKPSNDFTKTLFYQVFCNDSVSVESFFTHNYDLCLDYRYKDVLTDGVEIIYTKDYYRLYSPKLKTIFTVKPIKKETLLGQHLLWLLDVVRKYEPVEFDIEQVVKRFNYTKNG
jgi:hypothetical protein